MAGSDRIPERVRSCGSRRRLGNSGPDDNNNNKNIDLYTGKKVKSSTRRKSKKDKRDRTAEWVKNLSPEPENPPGLTPVPENLSDEDQLILPSPAMDPGSPTRASASRRHQDPSAIRGNFIPLSKSPTKSSMKPSPSPKRDQDSKGVYLQFSLTDSQMDKLAAALSDEGEGDAITPGRGRGRKVQHDRDHVPSPGPIGSAARMRSRSPGKTYKSSTTPARTRSKSPVKFDFSGTKASSHRARPTNDTDVFSSPTHHGRAGIFERDVSPYVSPTPVKHGNWRSARSPPPHIDTELAQAHAMFTGLRMDHLPTVAVHNPIEEMASPPRQVPACFSGESGEPVMSPSYYSQDSIGERYPSHITPLQVQKAPAQIQNPKEPKYLSVLEAYANEAFSTTGDSLLGSRDCTTGDQHSSDEDLRYTTLAAYLPEGVTHVRKASKTLIGEGGWLENTSKPVASPSPNRSGGFLTSLVKRAKEMIETNQEHRASRKSGKGKQTASHLAISLNPREQSLLYCELEFVIATALNDYLTAQFNAGRLQADRLSKIDEDWQRKGRARVVGFRYDMETQLDLVRAHVHDFKFHTHGGQVFAPPAGTSTAGPPTTATVLSTIDTAKAIARTLRVRTYCAPDMVIAKQLLDCQGLFNLLGCPDHQQIKLAEIMAFFRAAVEKQKILAEHEQKVREQQQKVAEQVAAETKAQQAQQAQQQREQQFMSLNQVAAQTQQAQQQQQQFTHDHQQPDFDPTTTTPMKTLPAGVNPHGPFAHKTGISAPILAAAQAYYDERTASANKYRREQAQLQAQQQLLREQQEMEQEQLVQQQEYMHEQQKLAWEQQREKEAYHLAELERRQFEREERAREQREKRRERMRREREGGMDPAGFYEEE
ncbi:hypothetical protein VTJ49DRAFT_6331 [Mycothermus thermophilus]|uniref:Uncharacterized protein n=1 Tax=Humicola insolens TaxID=85995 RepID=A0ABR3V2J1_HUMIN